jgi:hypothetical protein
VLLYCLYTNRLPRVRRDDMMDEEQLTKDGDDYVEAVNGHDYSILYTIVITLYCLTLYT